MSDTEDLAERLKGCTHANVKQLGEEHFTTDFLEKMSRGLAHGLRVTEGSGLQAAYHPTELDKCVIHYCVRNLIQDLWKFGTHTIKEFLDPNGRFDLEKALLSGDYGSLSDDLPQNLDVGREIYYGITKKIYDAWVDNLRERNKLGPEVDAIPLMFALYRYHNALVSGIGLQAVTILENTFTSAGSKHFHWLADYPNLSRQEIEQIAENSIGGDIQQASGLSIESVAIEKVATDVAERGDLPYIYDPKSNNIIFNPKYLQDVQREKVRIQGDYFDQTQLVLECPAKFVPSKIFEGGGMLHDLIRFRHSVFVEIYMENHNRP
jgi:hypothetical protein